MPERTCSIPGCEGLVFAKARGWCRKHDSRWQRHGDPTAGRLPNGVPRWCSVEGCERRMAAKGLCHLHWKRKRVGYPIDGPSLRLGRICSAEGCNRPHTAKGYCAAHYHRRYIRRYEGAAWDAPLLPRRRKGEPPARCRMDGCNGQATGRGLCPMHYDRQRQGRPMDAPKRGGGYVDAKGYRHIRRDGRAVLEHRYVMEQHLGRPLLPNETVHHKNSQRADNRPANLELWVGVGKQPRGSRAIDLLAWVEQVVARYGPERDKLQGSVDGQPARDYAGDRGPAGDD